VNNHLSKSSPAFVQSGGNCKLHSRFLHLDAHSTAQLVSLMQSASTYYVMRARQERARAAGTSSAIARRAHLELAVRLVNVATAPSSWSGTHEDVSDRTSASQTALNRSNLSRSVASAFSLPASEAFSDLLTLIDEAKRQVQTWSPSAI
jgi:hypothetical protein